MNSETTLTTSITADEAVQVPVEHGHAPAETVAATSHSEEVESMNTASTALLADMWDADGHMGGGWWIVMMLWMVVFWGAVIFGAVWLTRGGSFAGQRSTRREGPLETLDRRFAEGAISVDEYRERRDTLAGGAKGQRNEPGELADQ